MSTAIHLAGPESAPRVLDLMERCHQELALQSEPEHRDAAVLPLLEGSPLGAVWIVGPARAPLGYVIISFGWSVADGGMTGTLQEVFIRENVRRRGIGTEVVRAISVSLRKAGLRTLSAEMAPDKALAQRFCERCGLRRAPDTVHLIERL